MRTKKKILIEFLKRTTVVLQIFFKIMKLYILHLKSSNDFFREK